MNIVRKIIDKFRRKEITTTSIEDGWTHIISKTNSLIFGTYIHETHIDNQNPSISYYEIYELRRNGEKKLIYSNTGL
jgi:hypothetical protein